MAAITSEADPEAAFHEHVGRLQGSGFSVFRGGLSAAEVADTKAALLALHAEPEANLHYLYNRGEAFERVYSSAGGQQIHRIARYFLGDDGTQPRRWLRFIHYGLGHFQEIMECLQPASATSRAASARPAGIDRDYTWTARPPVHSKPRPRATTASGSSPTCCSFV